MAGRPALYQTPEELQHKVDEYLETFDLSQRTVTGLALFLGFESRQSLYDYEQDSQFSYIIKKAKLNIEHAYEMRLNNGNCTGAIFALKNMGWKDKTEQDLNVRTPAGITVNYNLQPGNEPLNDDSD